MIIITSKKIAWINCSTNMGHVDNKLILTFSNKIFFRKYFLSRNIFFMIIKREKNDFSHLLTKSNIF